MKVKLLIMSITLLCFLTTCASLSKTENKSSEEINVMYNHFSDSNSEHADSLLGNIIHSVQEKDSTSLYNLFSKYAAQSVDDLDAQIQMLFAFYNGDMVSYQRFGPGSHSTKEGNTYITEIEASYDIVTTSDTYRIAIKFCAINSADPENVGLLSVYIINADDSDMEFTYWGDGVWTPGITIETDVSDK